jgi:validoxylamine A glucosyltransferase
MQGMSVVVPTYNRAELLSSTLESLRLQRTDDDVWFEVIVCDDGSSDNTREIVDRYAGQLDLRYAWQPDRGHRVAAARNMGIALAQYSVIAMIDCGALASPSFVQQHYLLHRPFVLGLEASPLAVIGNTRGYRLDLDDSSVGAQAILHSPVDVALELAASDPRYEDDRTQDAARIKFGDLSWRQFWTTNVSVPTTVVRSMGGFDTAFEGWGGEDIELGFRLEQHGAQFVWAEDAWALELPQPRDHGANRVTNYRNLRQFLVKHEHIDIELYVGAKELGKPFAEVLERFRHWQGHEAEAHAPWWPMVRADVARGVVEFDAVAAPATPSVQIGEAVKTLPAIGIHTPFNDAQFALAKIAPRIAGLWEDWGELLMAEARRIGRDVHLPPTVGLRAPALDEEPR